MITEERLKEIIKKSGFDVRGDEIFVYGRCDDYDVEISDEIMQLIRQVAIECAEVAANHDALDIYENIRDYFGIDQQQINLEIKSEKPVVVDDNIWRKIDNHVLAEIEKLKEDK